MIAWFMSIELYAAVCKAYIQYTVRCPENERYTAAMCADGLCLTLILIFGLFR